MARVRKSQSTLDSIFFATPEQKVIRFLLSEPTTAFTPRVISSKLKGVRGLGGTEGIMKILTDLQGIGFVDFVDNNRAVRVRDDSPIVSHMKAFGAVCDLEGLKALLEPVSSRGILYGARAAGKAHSDSEYDLFVVSDTPEEVRKITARHPLGRKIALRAVSPQEHDELEATDGRFFSQVASGITLWGTSW